MTEGATEELNLPMPRKSCIEKCILCFYWPTLIVWVLLIPFLIVVGVLLVRFLPHEPVTSVCYDGLDWASIVKNINPSASGYYADYELVVSIYNPNRVDLVVGGITGTVHYPANGSSAQEVGTLTLGKFFAKGGSISDTVGILSLSMTRWNALGMGGDYAKGHLEIALDLGLTFKVNASENIPVLSALYWYSEYQLQPMVVNVNDPDDHTHCLCK